MKDFCVDLEISKELKENGYFQETLNWYIEDIKTGKIYFNKSQYPTESKTYYAPFPDEILKELPREIKDPNFDYFYHLKIEKSPIHDEMYLISYGITSQDRAWMEQYNTDDKKLSNALAKMWIYLKKEGYIK